MEVELSKVKKLGNGFNRYIISYKADGYMKGNIAYLACNERKEEEFFLEPGEGTFSSFIDGFFDNIVASDVTWITIKPLNSDCEFILNEITLDKVSVPETTVFIENEYCRVGVDLLWGGGLNYIEDIKSKDDSLTNLLNRCDTGRLVQQSYYGTRQDPYVMARYNNANWSYNPVQGGDQYGNSSKLVDYRVEGNSVYIKCRPRDWAQRSMYTISYMENTYSLVDNVIKVDNRFVDFSGYKATPGHQELPAFYVISYLDTFAFYDGNRPWSDDELTFKYDLPFWGGSEHNHCVFNVKDINDETWCAWVDRKNYGIGLYVPETEVLLAGRHVYNGSKDPKDHATNYVAPLRTFELKSFNPFEYSYLITAGVLGDIRNTFKINRDLKGVK